MSHLERALRVVEVHLGRPLNASGRCAVAAYVRSITPVLEAIGKVAS